MICNPDDKITTAWYFLKEQRQSQRPQCVSCARLGVFPIPFSVPVSISGPEL